MRLALTWYVFGLVLVGWGLTLARELHWLPAVALPLERVAGYAVLGAIPFFIVALVVALWPSRERALYGDSRWVGPEHDHQAAD